MRDSVKCGNRLGMDVWSAALLCLAVQGVGLVYAQAGDRARGQGARGWKREGSSARSAEIHSGCVIFRGRYIPPPYTLEFARGRIRVNALTVSAPRSPGSRGLPGRRGTPSGPWPARTLLRMEQHLRNEGLMIIPEQGETLLIPVGRAVTVLDVLMSDESTDAKVQTLLEAEPSMLTANQWAPLVERFEGTEALRCHVAEIRENLATIEAEFVDEASWACRFPYAGVTILGFALAVWALGTLLSARGPTRLDGSDLVQSPVSSRQVVRLVVLVLVLGLYDLVCTLSAQHLGGLWELNPFAHSLMGHDLLITGAKLAMTVGAGVVLVLARHCRLAQTASWWIGVVYTVLILRWATCTSVLMG